MQKITRGHWANVSNHKNFMAHLGKKLGYTKAEDWYNISNKQIKEFGGSGFLGPYYNGSAIQYIKSMIPEYNYKGWLFTNAPQGYWNSVDNAKEYLEWLYSMKGFKSQEDWYSLRQDDLFKYDGRGLYSKYNCSILSILNSVYPEKEWLPWLFTITTAGTWNNIENHKRYISWLADKLEITEPTGWYDYGANVIEVNKGNGLITNCYGGSISKLLKVAYPEYNFIGYKFKQAPNGYWQDDYNCREWLSDYMVFHNYISPEELYKTRYDVLIEFPSARGIIDRFNGSYIRMIMHLYPELEITGFFKAGQSKIANEWLSSLEKNSVSLEREFRIPGTRWRVDGYDPTTKTVYEFLGDYWHGNPSKYSPEKLHPVTGYTYGEMLETTMKRLEEIRSIGYEIVSVWENDWKNRG